MHLNPLNRECYVIDRVPLRCTIAQIWVRFRYRVNPFRQFSCVCPLPTGISDGIQRYDPASNSWTLVPTTGSSPGALYNVGLATAPNGEVYLYGGTSNSEFSAHE